MHVPKHFSNDSRAAALEFIRAEPFGMLVSEIGGRPFATHVPFVITAHDPQLMLGLHIARVNSHWEHLDGTNVLVVFQRAHAHISAAWYEEPSLTVPTWNYAAIHCTGRATLTDAMRTRGILEQLVGEIEGDAGWRMDDADTDCLEKMQRGIVGIEIAVERIDAQFKYSQNRTESDRRRVIDRLTASSDSNARQLAEEMTTYYARTGEER
ncbi:MAG: FMN-binding negative transcriptional regulator [Candidatus Eremiobacteraeota bacterium]|nr:FMN-binding negative transcriptional regulator [Candidatus Eremiobacteraeota bacterium]